MEHRDKGEGPQAIETTIGDLIAAIAEAAREASIAEADVSKLTHYILTSLLERKECE